MTTRHALANMSFFHCESTSCTAVNGPRGTSTSICGMLEQLQMRIGWTHKAVHTPTPCPTTQPSPPTCKHMRLARHRHPTAAQFAAAAAPTWGADCCPPRRPLSAPCRPVAGPRCHRRCSRTPGDLHPQILRDISGRWIFHLGGAFCQNGGLSAM